MSTAFTHAFVAVAAGKTAYPEKMSLRFWILAVACSVGPDLDVGLFRFGVAYGDLWGHRGMTHSLLFAMTVALLIVMWPLRSLAPLGSRAWWGLFGFFFALTASHGFIDAFTDGGLGIAFLSPFDTTRYFMPWRPLPVPYFAPAQLFTAYGARMMVAEVILVWLPMTCVWLVATLWRHLRPPAESG